MKRRSIRPGREALPEDLPERGDGGLLQQQQVMLNPEPSSTRHGFAQGRRHLDCALPAKTQPRRGVRTETRGFGVAVIDRHLGTVEFAGKEDGGR